MKKKIVYISFIFLSLYLFCEENKAVAKSDEQINQICYEELLSNFEETLDDSVQKIQKQYEEKYNIIQNEFKNENDKLEIQLEATKDSFNRSTSAYWASLGIIAGLIAIILGGSFFSQKIDAKKTLEQLENEMRIEYNGYKTTIDNVLNKKIEESTNRISLNYKREADKIINRISSLELDTLISKYEFEKYKKKMGEIGTPDFYALLALVKICESEYLLKIKDSTIVELLTYIEFFIQSGNKFESTDYSDLAFIFEKLSPSYTEQVERIKGSVQYNQRL